ncbi:MAG: D-alanine--D-alanine ligase [bacterium]|nr:D-alanine--D-alanine ligase [bacterium]
MRNPAQNNKLRVAVFMGGWSHERSISLQSGATMFHHLVGQRYTVRAVELLPDRRARVLSPDIPPEPEALQKERPLPLLDALHTLLHWPVDVAMLALHGVGGEDGVIQGALELLNIPHSHSTVAGAAISMDKIISKRLFTAYAIPTPPFFVITNSNDALAQHQSSGFGWPVVMKSPCLGSSFEVHIVRAPEAFLRTANHLLELDRRVLVERYIEGREFTCAVLQRHYGAPPEALPVTEIVPVHSEFFDFDAKYTPGATREITPAPIPAELAQRIQHLAVQCHQALQCESVSRTDIMMDRQGALFALETNMIPGMTKLSLLPQAAKHAGISYRRLLQMMVEYAHARATTNRAPASHSLH